MRCGPGPAAHAVDSSDPPHFSIPLVSCTGYRLWTRLSCCEVFSGKSVDVLAVAATPARGALPRANHRKQARASVGVEGPLGMRSISEHTSMGQLGEEQERLHGRRRRRRASHRDTVCYTGERYPPRGGGMELKELPAELVSFVEQALASGTYASVEALVADAMRVLRDQEAGRPARPHTPETPVFQV